MKTRNGFVSNSSTSSFCIFGIAVEQDEFLRNLTDQAKAAFGSADLEDVDWYDIEHALSQAGLTQSLEFWRPDYDSTIFIGRRFSSIGDDETGAQFKAKVIAEVGAMMNVKASKFGTLEEAWHD